MSEPIDEESNTSATESDELRKALASEQRARRIETEFLKRASRAGVRHADDALKLADPLNALGDEQDIGSALDALVEQLRKGRPWLFAGSGTPAPRMHRDDEGVKGLRKQAGRSALTRDLQALREAMKKRTF